MATAMYMDTANGGAPPSEGMFVHPRGAGGQGALAVLSLVGLTTGPSAAPLDATFPGGHAARPTSHTRQIPQVPPAARRHGRTTPPRARSPSPRRAVGIAPDEGSVAGSDAQPAALSNADVVKKVKRSFASVRAGLTEQRAQSVELARQMAAGTTKIDQLTVAYECAANVRAADQATLATMMPHMNEMKTIMAAAGGGDGHPEQETEKDSEAWVALAKACSFS